MHKTEHRIFCAIGGLFGAGGIAAYAAAAHLGGHFESIAPILLGNAPLLIALSLSNRSGLLTRLGGALIILGVTLFTGDIVMREMTEHKLFPFAAPLGGMATILGWLLFVISALVPHDRPQDE